MAQKRTSTDAGIRSVIQRTLVSKRTRTTPPHTSHGQPFPQNADTQPLDLQHSTSAIQMLEHIDHHTEIHAPSDSASDLSESISSSSEESDSDSDSDSEDDLSSEHAQDKGSEAEIIHLGGPQKPTMSSNLVTTGAADLKSRLSAFLPRLQQANRELNGGGPESNLEQVSADQEQYIEMDLGLGVLEEKPAGDEHGDSSDSDEENGEDEGESETEFLEGEEGQRTTMKTERDVMGTLMGLRRREPAGIEVVDNNVGESS